MPETPGTGQPAAPPPLSRRRLIQHATVAGAATMAAGFALDTALAGTAAAARRPADGTASAGTASHTRDEPFVVRLVDARTGELDIFHGHLHHRVRDRKLAAELLRAAR